MNAPKESPLRSARSKASSAPVRLPRSASRMPRLTDPVESPRSSAREIRSDRTRHVPSALEETAHSARAARVPVGVGATVRGHRGGQISLRFKLLTTIDRGCRACRLTGCHPTGQRLERTSCLGRRGRSAGDRRVISRGPGRCGVARCIG